MGQAVTTGAAFALIQGAFYQVPPTVHGHSHSPRLPTTSACPAVPHAPPRPATSQLGNMFGGGAKKEGPAEDVMYMHTRGMLAALGLMVRGGGLRAEPSLSHQHTRGG